MVGERSAGEKINGTIDDNFVERDFGGENLFDGAAGGKFKRIAEAVTIDFGSGNPTETSGGGFL